MLIKLFTIVIMTMIMLRIMIKKMIMEAAEVADSFLSGSAL